MYQNPQYDYDYSRSGPLAPLHDRSAHPDYPVMISPPFGWVPLVLKLNEDLAALLPDYTIAQVKEKFAGLRFYIDTYGVSRDDPRIDIAHELISEAESASQRICQICGSPGTFRPELAWHATLCADHAG